MCLCLCVYVCVRVACVPRPIVPALISQRTSPRSKPLVHCCHEVALVVGRTHAHTRPCPRSRTGNGVLLPCDRARPSTHTQTLTHAHTHIHTHTHTHTRRQVHGRVPRGPGPGSPRQCRTDRSRETSVCLVLCSEEHGPESSILASFTAVCCFVPTLPMFLYMVTQHYTGLLQGARPVLVR